MQEQDRTQDISFSEQEQIRREKLNTLIQEGKSPYDVTKYDKSHNSDFIVENYDKLENMDISIAGRMTSRRVMGKASFAHLLDAEGTIQIYVKRDDVGEDVYEAFKLFDLGDVLGVRGKVFKTRTGEISVHAESVELLSKCLKPLPEKFHGLQDADLRYRQRYLHGQPRLP